MLRPLRPPANSPCAATVGARMSCHAIYDMHLSHPLTLALRHLTPSRTIDGIAALPVWLDPARRPAPAGLPSRLDATFAAGLSPAVNLFAGSVERLAPEDRADVVSTAA